MSLTVLPLAITMNAGPQIMSAIIFITASKPLKLSAYFLAGVAIAVTVGVTITYTFATARQQHLAWRPLQQRIARQHNPVPARRAARIPVHQELRAPRDDRAPEVAGRSTKRQAQDGVQDRTAAAFGFPLRLRHSDNGRHEPRAATTPRFWPRVPFVAATIFIAALPVLSYLLFRRRAQRLMPKVRDWMNTHSWLVNIIVYVIFIMLILFCECRGQRERRAAMTLHSGRGDLTAPARDHTNDVSRRGTGSSRPYERKENLPCHRIESSAQRTSTVPEYAASRGARLEGILGRVSDAPLRDGNSSRC